MSLNQLVGEFEKVDDLYLRKDNQCVAALSSDKNTVGFVKIYPLSKKNFEGLGMVVEDLHLFNPSANTFILTSARVDDYTDIENDKKLLTMSEDNIKEFLGNTSEDPDTKMASYLNDFAKVACEAYAVDTFGNKVRNYVETLKLKYGMTKFRREQRRLLKNQLESQIPLLVDQVEQMLKKAEDYLGTGEGKELEKLFGEQLDEIIKKSRDELHKVIDKNIMKNATWTGTRNVAEYSMHNSFTKIAPNSLMFEKFEFNGNFKINC